MKEYYKQLYARDFDSLDELDKIIERYNLPNLIQGKMYNRNSPLFIKEIESIIYNLT